MKFKFIIALLFFAINTTHLLSAEEVQANDIGSKVIIIGKLGKPLGTVVTMEGQIVSDPKQEKNGHFVDVIRVSKVDDKQLEKAATITLMFQTSAETLSIHAHDIIKISGYESGSYIGTPDKARDELGKDASPLDWKFETFVYVIKSEPPKP